MTENKKRYDISMLRVFSMVMIILCHIIKNYPFPYSDKLSEVFNAFVYTFLGMSGYLFGGKEIKKFREWFANRIKRIWIPVIVIVVADTLLLTLFSNELVTKRQFLVYFFNLQGLLFIDWSFFNKIFGGEIINLVPLWFTTVIMICYGIVPSLQWIRDGITKMFRYTWLFILIVLFSIFGVLEYSNGFHGFYFAAFTAGYGLGDFHNRGKRLGKSTVICMIALTMILQIGRLIVQRQFDGSAMYSTYIGYSHTALGLIFLITFTELGLFKESLFSFGKSAVIKKMDAYSMYVYMVHQLFCARPWNVYERHSIFISTILFIICTCAAAYILRIITERIIGYLDSLQIKRTITMR